MLKLCPRSHAYTDDFAAEYLRGLIERCSYVCGRRATVSVPTATMRKAAKASSEASSELVYGEQVHLYGMVNGFALVQSLHDGYVGYIQPQEIGPTPPSPINMMRVTAPTTLLLSRPNARASVLSRLSFGSYIEADIQEASDSDARAVFDQTDSSDQTKSTTKQEPRAYFVHPKTPNEIEICSSPYIQVQTGGYIHRAALCAAANWASNQRTVDVVDVALSFLGVPYVWGGRSGFGLDCSGLVQLCMSRAGYRLRRDTDQQQRQLEHLPQPQATHLKRGDLVYFKGHVGFALDSDQLLHATAHSLRVCIEPLADVIARAGPVLATSRI